MRIFQEDVTLPLSPEDGLFSHFMLNKMIPCEAKPQLMFVFDVYRGHWIKLA